MRPASARSRPYRMRIKVVLPAPFSPPSAWISPSATSKVIRSLASTPGKAFEISSMRTRAPASAIGGCGRGAAAAAPSTLLLLLSDVGDFELAGDNVLAQLLHPVDVGLGDDVARELHLAQPHPALLQAEGDDSAALQAALHQPLHQVIHRQVDALQHAGQHVSGGDVVLIGVHSNGVAAGPLGGGDHAFAGTAGPLIDDIRTLLELGQPQLLPLGGVAERVGVANQYLGLLVDELCPFLIPHDELVDPDRLGPTDHSDDLPRVDPRDLRG